MVWHLKRIFDLDVKLAGVRRWRTMARPRVLAVWLVGSGCFTDNGPPQGGASGSTSEVGVTTSAAEMSTSGSTSGTGTQTSGGVEESSEVSTGGEVTTMDPETTETSPETTDGPVPAGCPADTGLLACYRFEALTDVTPDESSYAHPAKVALATLAEGRVGMGLDVTAMSQVQASDADHLTPGESYTMSAWFNARTLPTQIGYRMMILNKDSEYGIVIRTTGLGCTFASGGIPEVQVPVMANKWTHVACVHTPEGIGELYVDGQPIGMGDVGPAEMLAISSPLSIGNDSPVPKPTDGFDGVIDEVKIWGRALTAEEIQAQAGP